MVEGLELPAHRLKLLAEQGAHVLIIIQNPEQDRRMVGRVDSHFSGESSAEKVQRRKFSGESDLLKGIEENYHVLMNN
jgi:hypothetical protein